MFRGIVVSIHITPSANQPMQRVSQVEAIAGQGLAGDRYALATGTYSNRPGPDRQVTLIEVEAIEALEREASVQMEPGAARRNIVTRGVPLNHLVGQEFRVGEIRLRGIRLCEPCQNLAGHTQPAVLPGLVHRGGLRAEIVSGGMLHAGDIIEVQ